MPRRPGTIAADTSEQSAKQRAQENATRACPSTSDQAIQLRNELRHSLRRMNELIHSLQRQKREQRLMQTTLKSLKEMQTV